jgi:hypothetical protein
VSVPTFVPTESVSSNDLPVSLGAANITLITHVPPSGSVLPTHLLGSSVVKLAPLLTPIDLTSTLIVPALIVTDLLTTSSGATLPNSTGEGDRLGPSPVSESEIDLVLSNPVTVVDVPLRLALPKIAQLVPVSGIFAVSSHRRLLITPPLRFATSSAGAFASDLARHVTLEIVRLALIPIRRIVTLDMFGSVPLKLPYSRCHGSVSVRSLIEPALHELIPAFVTSPIGDLSTFAIVVLLKLPSSVMSQLMPSPGMLNLIGAHTDLNVASLSESCIAAAELPASARIAAARTAASSVRRTRLRTDM